MHTEQLPRAVLLGLEPKARTTQWTVGDSLDELGRLARTAGLDVAGRMWQKAAHPDPTTWVGKGKVEELKDLVSRVDARYVLCDDEITPGQQRKLESAVGPDVQVIDRTGLVLDIFSLHARTHEGKVQVELAQYQYLMPRLAGMRTGLSQQTGGAGAGPVGLRGPGETQLELDRRRARRRVTVLRRSLEDLRAQRHLHRARRERSGLPVIALVGYTNAGKSSLLNALTGAGVLVEDKLFSTLDPTTRRIKLPHGREALLTDTVGFIRKLPHDLVAAFRATLEGIEEASLILHVVDSTHIHAHEQIDAVEVVLAGLTTSGIPRLVVWNKIDLLPPDAPLAALPTRHETAVTVSARTGAGLDELRVLAEDLLARDLVETAVLIPYDRYELIRLVYEQGTVLAKDETDAGVHLRASLPAALHERLAVYRVKDPDQAGP